MLKLILIVFVLLIVIVGVIFLTRKVIFPKKNIYVGILFTTKGGVMADLEKKQHDIIMDLIKIYNSSQSKINLIPVHYNPESNTELYEKYAEKLTTDPKITLVFGVWRSNDRKAVKPIFEKNNNLLCYPVQYEGDECSKNIFYFGATPNQQINIGIEYGIKNLNKNIVLLGSDYVFPKKANDIMKLFIDHYEANLTGEYYVSLDEKNFDTIVDEILTNNPDGCLIMNTINGDSNMYFFETLYRKYQEKQKQDILKIPLYAKYPIMSFSVGDYENQLLPIEQVYNTYSVWNYNQLDYTNKLNDVFFDNSTNELYKKNAIKNIYDYIRNTNKIIGDVEYHTFLSFYFFVSFLERGNVPDTPKDIREKYVNSIRNVNLITPTGYLNITDNNHLNQPVMLLQVTKDKRFDVLYRTPGNIYPMPWYRPYREIQLGCDQTNSFLGDKYVYIKSE